MGILPVTAWAAANIVIEYDEKWIVDLLESLECPEHLDRLELYDDAVWERFCEAHYKDLLFHLEQSCDSTGRLLSDEIRKTKLQTIPINQHWELEKFIQETEPDVLDQVAYFAFWLARFERLARTGTADLLNQEA